MSFWIIGTDHLARCICNTNTGYSSACPIHQVSVRVFPPESQQEAEA